MSLRIRDTNILSRNTPRAGEIFSSPIHFLAFGFGSGLAPKAPGTFGTLAAIPFYYLIIDWPAPIYLGFLILTFLLGVYLCDRSAKELGVHDHPGIVWDEMVGYWIVMFAAPAGWPWALLGFVLFRFFDIVKPWPIGWIDEKVSGGFGIMLDDVLAALFAWGLLQVVAWFWL